MREKSEQQLASERKAKKEEEQVAARAVAKASKLVYGKGVVLPSLLH